MGRSKKRRKCPRCGSSDVLLQDTYDDGFDLYLCAECDYEFEIDTSTGSYSSDDEDDYRERDVAEDSWDR